MWHSLLLEFIFKCFVAYQRVNKLLYFLLWSYTHGICDTAVLALHPQEHWHSSPCCCTHSACVQTCLHLGSSSPGSCCSGAVGSALLWFGELHVLGEGGRGQAVSQCSFPRSVCWWLSLLTARRSGSAWHVGMEGQHEHPQHLGDQTSALCKLPGQDFQHDPQVSTASPHLPFSALLPAKISALQFWALRLFSPSPLFIAQVYPVWDAASQFPESNFWWR